MENLKLKTFWLIILIPLLILMYIFLRIAVDIYKINHINHKAVLKNLEDYFSAKGDWVIPITNELSDIDDKTFNIFVFGESSVVISDSNTFSQYLESGLKNDQNNTKVFNFGYSGMDSYSIKYRVKQAVNASKVKPGLAVFYMGHNEFDNAYNRVIKSAYPNFNYLLRPSHLFAKKKNPRVIVGMEYYWFARLKKPSIIDLLQNYNLVNLDTCYLPEYNDLILQHFKNNIKEILSFLTENQIPVIIFTPIGNYQAKPFGNKTQVNINYEKGIAEKDYNKSLDYLIKAKDFESLTFDLRAKSMLTDYLISIQYKNVFIVNLEKELKKDLFRFDDSNFLDYFHLKNSAHKIIGRKIKEKIYEEKEILFKGKDYKL